MKKKWFYIGIGLLVLFAIFMVICLTIDVREIGDTSTKVGLSTINEAWWKFTGVNDHLFDVTEFLGKATVAIGSCYAILGLYQWIKRVNMLKVDFCILMLGCFYIFLILINIFFENVAVINYRPILMDDGTLEGSFPSSTTLRAVCFLSTGMMLNYRYFKKTWVKHTITVIEAIWMIFIVIGRLFCGYHWFIDIIGAILFGVGMDCIYYSIIDVKLKFKEKDLGKEGK